MKQTTYVATQNSRIIRVKDVMSLTGLKRTSLYIKVREKKFPQPLKLGARAVGWRESDVMTWMDNLETSKGGHHVS